jgi:hypothetical protein
MKKFSVVMALVTLALMLVSAGWAQQGQPPQGGAGWGGKPGAGRLSNPQNLETLSGLVVGVEHQTVGKKKTSLVRLTLKTDAETIPVILGPAYYVDQQNLALAANDAVTIKGFRASRRGQTAIMAVEVTKGGNTIRLRDDQGKPLWAGSRRPRRSQ